MFLICAALMEELEAALSLCSDRTRLRCPGARLWTAQHRDASLHFLKTGIGPERAGRALEKALGVLHASRILIIGYAGALDGGLRLGDLAVIRRIVMLGGAEKGSTALEHADISGAWDLEESSALLEVARRSGTPTHLCDGLTSPHIIGEPEQKRRILSRFGVSVVDMETAALARIAAAHTIPLGCVRAVSDESDDSFLAPFAYDPASTPVRRAVRVLSSGNWIRRYGEWRKRAALAHESLHRFMTVCLARMMQDF